MPRAAPPAQALNRKAPSRIVVTMINFFFIEKTLLLWDGIVAPGVERITSEDAPGSHQRSLECAIFIDCLVSVVRTGWIEPAGVFRHPFRQGGLIEPDQRQDGNP